MNKRLHIYYSGMVQGVGFRFAVERTAMTLNLKGWVKNLRDGRVEAILDGEESKLTLFLDKMMKGSMKPYIHSAEISWQDTIGESGDFRIIY